MQNKKKLSLRKGFLLKSIDITKTVSNPADFDADVNNAKNRKL